MQNTSFHDLHRPGDPFVLPNAWDVPSALAYVADGFTAVGAAKVAEIKRCSPELFVNARVDTYWLRQEANTAATIERALRYVEAGADGIFVPLANDRAELALIARNVPRPINTLPVPGLTLAELGELGVARVSTGSIAYSAGLYAAARPLVRYATVNRRRHPRRTPSCKRAWSTTRSARTQRDQTRHHISGRRTVYPMRRWNDDKTTHCDREPARPADPGRR